MLHLGRLDDAPQATDGVEVVIRSVELVDWTPEPEVGAQERTRRVEVASGQGIVVGRHDLLRRAGITRHGAMMAADQERAE